MPAGKQCVLCTTLPGTLRPKQRTTRCLCGGELQFHTIGHPHGFAGFIPGCKGFQERPAPPACEATDSTQLSLLTETTSVC